MVVDYHDFTHRNTSRIQREKLGVGDIYVNGLECLKCGYFIRSRNRHDRVTCKCGNCSVDGGSFYHKFSAMDFKMVKSILEYYTDLEEKE